MTISAGLAEEKCLAMEGIHMLNAVLSACSTALGIESSAHVSPSRARFWVVAKMGMLRMEAALIIFWVVRMLVLLE